MGMKKDQTSSLICLSLALFICVETMWKLPLGSLRDPGPGFFPFGAGIALGLLSAVNFVLSLLDKSPKDKEAWYPRERWKTLVLILAAMLAYAFSLETLGFLTGTFLLLILFFRSTPKPQGWAVSIGGSVLLSLAAYVIFDVLLGSQLPIGIWGF
jgi:putative tricarboxylic transport membrane protein